MTIGFLVTIAVFLGLLFFLIREVRRPVRDSKWDHAPRRYKRLRIALMLDAPSAIDETQLKELNIHLNKK